MQSGTPVCDLFGSPWKPRMCAYYMKVYDVNRGAVADHSSLGIAFLCVGAVNRDIGIRRRRSSAKSIPRNNFWCEWIDFINREPLSPESWADKVSSVLRNVRSAREERDENTMKASTHVN